MQSPSGYTVGDKIAASGELTPIEYVSSDHWQKYNIKGIFSVLEFVRVSN